MDESIVMEIAVRELTGAVNQIAQVHQIKPSLMRFVLNMVSTKLNDMAVTELSEEVAKLKLEIAKSKTKIDEEKASSEEVKEVETEKVSVNSKTRTKSERKSGTLKDLIADLKASGVEVPETHYVADENGTRVEEVPYEPTGENNEVTK